MCCCFGGSGSTAAPVDRGQQAQGCSPATLKLGFDSDSETFSTVLADLWFPSVGILSNLSLEMQCGKRKETREPLLESTWLSTLPRE